MNLISKLPRVAAYIYRKNYFSSHHIEPDPKLDWAGNLAHMMGHPYDEVKRLLRLYMVLHSDHEGGQCIGACHTPGRICFKCIDGRRAEDIELVIAWRQKSDFWGPNILSGKKLRDKFDTLIGQMNRQYERHPRDTVGLYDGPEYEKPQEYWDEVRRRAEAMNF